MRWYTVYDGKTEEVLAVIHGAAMRKGPAPDH